MYLPTGINVMASEHPWLWIVGCGVMMPVPGTRYCVLYDRVIGLRYNTLVFGFEGGNPTSNSLGVLENKK